jgi:hypothetical protein
MKTQPDIRLSFFACGKKNNTGYKLPIFNQAVDIQQEMVQINHLII